MNAVRYVVYLRVSTDVQGEQGQGLAVQEEACRAWLRSGRHRLVAVCSDVGRSGLADAADRPGLAEAMAYVLGDEADGIVVYRLDRLARDVVLQETLLAELGQRGAQLHSCSATEDAHLGDDPDDPTRALVRRILGAIASYERDVIRLRLRAGVARRLHETGYAAGRPPYGWAARKGELVPVDDELVVVDRMLALSRDGLSIRQIASRLECDGIKSRKRDGLWRPGTIGEIIRRGTRRPDYRKAA